MALLAEEVVEEWLNRQGYFTIRGIRMGVDEIDILTIKPNNKGELECRHIEVQASINPVSYLTPLTKDLQKKLGVAPMSMRKRTPEVMKECVKSWIDKKFLKIRKTKIRDSLYSGKWSYELVINKVKFPEELKIVEQLGIKVHYLKDIVKDMLKGGQLIKSASGVDLVNLMLLGKGNN